MTIVTTRLTDKEIKTAKPRNKEYNLFDDDRLCLRIIQTMDFELLQSPHVSGICAQL